MKQLKTWSMMMLMVMALPLMVACGGDDDNDNTKSSETKVYPIYRFSEYLISDGYATPDFTQPQNGYKDGETYYKFRYNIKLVDENSYRYDFTLVEDISSSSINAKIIWVTDSKYNFTVLWNDKTKEYDIISGYFKGGKINVNVSMEDTGVYDSITNTYHAMRTINNCTITLDNLSVVLGTPR